MAFIYKGAEYGSIKHVPIPYCQTIDQARLRKKEIVRTTIDNTHFLVDKETLFPSQESFSFGLMMGFAIKSVCHAEQECPYIVVDYGIGSGVISLAMGKVLQEEIEKGMIRIIGTDVSGYALQLSDVNARINNIHGIELRRSSDVREIKHEFGRIDFLIANPPWYPTEIALTKCGDYFPLSAVDGGDDGLNSYRQLILDAHVSLSDFGTLVVRTQHEGFNKIYNLINHTLRRPTSYVLATRNQERDDSKIFSGIMHGSINPGLLKKGEYEYAMYLSGGFKKALPQLYIQEIK